MKQESPTGKRLFLALWPTAAEQAQLHDIVRRYPGPEKNRLIAAHRLHLTLRFLGTVETETELCVRRMAAQLSWQAFNLRFDRIGWFAQPKVLWAGCSTAPTELKELVGKIQTGLVRCGFEPEQRNYQPHVTFARNVRRSPQAKEIESVSCYFDRVALVESRMDQHGAEYITLATWPAQHHRA